MLLKVAEIRDAQRVKICQILNSDIDVAARALYRYGIYWVIPV